MTRTYSSIVDDNSQSITKQKTIIIVNTKNVFDKKKNNTLFLIESKDERAVVNLNDEELKNLIHFLNTLI